MAGEKKDRARTNVVSFRVTDQELTVLQDICRAARASHSDVLREALLLFGGAVGGADHETRY